VLSKQSIFAKTIFMQVPMSQTPISNNLTMHSWFKRPRLNFFCNTIVFNSHRQNSLVFLLFLLVGLSGFSASAQSADSDTTEVKKEKVKKEPMVLKPISLRVGTDIYSLLLTGLDSEFSGFELNADVSLNNYFFLTADYGTHKSERADDEQNFGYTNQGSFVRIGIEHNILGRQFSKNAVFVGAKYAVANFKHEIAVLPENSYWGNTEIRQIKVENISAQWFELNGGLKIEVLKNIYLAGILRVKFRTKLDESQGLAVGEIPGYGINKSNIRGGFSYQILYRLPFGKK
jgi:hypothetical protein